MNLDIQCKVQSSSAMQAFKATILGTTAVGAITTGDTFAGGRTLTPGVGNTGSLSPSSGRDDIGMLILFCKVWRGVPHQSFTGSWWGTRARHAPVVTWSPTAKPALALWTVRPLPGPGPWRPPPSPPTSPTPSHSHLPSCRTFSQPVRYFSSISGPGNEEKSSTTNLAWATFLGCSLPIVR